jgi:ribosome-binding ATPase
MVKPDKTTPAVIEFVDIAGLVRGAHDGEGLGNKFLSNIREVDAIVHVVRCFKDENIAHVSGKIDPVGDIEVVNLELIFADIESIEKRLEKSRRSAKSGEKDIIREVEILQKIKDELGRGKLLRNIELAAFEKQLAESLFLLTDKPVLYALNISEDDIGRDENNPDIKNVRDYAAGENSGIVLISAKIEEELMQLDRNERLQFMIEMGIPETGMDRMVTSCYKLMDLISFFTIKLPEVRAWTIKRGTEAPRAAGKIHTDFERGFIGAEVIDYQSLMDAGSFHAVREKGLVRQEGRQYIIRDGDVILFKFNI